LFSFALAVAGLAACHDGPPPTAPDIPDSGSAAAAAQVGATAVRHIVVLNPSIEPGGPAARRSRAASVAAEFGVSHRHAFGTALFGFSGALPEGRLQALLRDPRVLRVEAVEARRLDIQGADTETLPTGMDRIEIDQQLDGSGVTIDVATIDSGVDQSHPDLNVAGGANFANGPSGNFNDGNGHGSHVAGTMAAIDNGIGVVGAAPGARIWAARVCGNSGFCFTDDMVAGIDWVAARKQAGEPIAVANMSISSSDDDTACTGSSGAVHEAICGLMETGVVLTLSAGNDNRAKKAYPEALVVAAIADFDGREGALGSPTCRTDGDDTRANFSNHEGSTTTTTIDITAPGVCILSTWKSGGYNTISGTSMSSPHVAGALARYAALTLGANGLPGDRQGADDLITAFLAANTVAQSSPCGYANDGESSFEPMLLYGGAGACGAGGPVNKAPVVTITNPADGSSFSSGTSITFTGTATDEDGDLSGSLQWTSDLDDAIGTGASISVVLSDGSHTITAAATDADLSTGDATIQVTAGDPPPPPAGITVTNIDPGSLPAPSSAELVTVTGEGFQAGATLTFENGAGPSPSASVTSVGDGGTSLQALVSIKSGGPPIDRTWDARVTNSDGATGVLFGGFTVTP
jgi:subtilisin family serine protease